MKLLRFGAMNIPKMRKIMMAVPTPGRNTSGATHTIYATYMDWRGPESTTGPTAVSRYR